jgi:NADH:ubiquinone oxidoreductase subunit 5 (subunit L)/multisubunit Na+/H+ antiporter MnhA subunit
MAAAGGTLLAWVIYGAGWVNPGEIKRQLAGVHGFLVEKWQFDRLYDAMFVYPVHVVARAIAWFDRVVIDGLIHSLSAFTVWLATKDRWFDEKAIDGLVNVFGDSTYRVGRSFRHVQTGLLRQYIMFIAVGVLALFLLMFAMFPT